MKLSVNIHKELTGFTLKTSFETMEGSPLGLLGASGSGKSMILRCIAGLETPTNGRIVLNERVLFDSEEKIDIPSRKRKVGFLFQNYALFPHMTIAENIAFALGDLTKKQRSEKVKEYITMMKLQGLEERYPSQLSGGQQQRVAIARALAIEPEVLLLDEPFSALDNHLKGQIEKQLIETLASYKGTSIFVSHNMEEVYRICDNVIILSEGKVEAYGKKGEIFENPPTIKVAQLTGCSNFSRIQPVATGVFEAVDWGCRLKVEKPVPESVTYVGIKPSNIDLRRNVQGDNVFEGSVVGLNEGLQTVTVYLSLKKFDGKSSSHYLQWEVSKEKWARVEKQTTSWFICLDEGKLFFME
ncbi:sulfate/molybdate ABC transporter ATP-binding protein [Clostridium formicaceticum]|uniref:ABC transporter n=1 Tax=Clostridium formicaceticum TaxID=1497 RepID=A0AAC9RHD2_9CLOT|nr:sulfate/molybdate ABC transporter ATP-binding protein [Clostridium formicaceticum]AOY76601.1 ABC transporter [Clostridium formicaceticum]ARE87021.1 Sulfate/thiosulfate import ATP-binding protein CysA [Clostridium formicaceticum]